VSGRVVTVDGPAGSGKSTLGRLLAAELGLPLIDTGLFYRGVMVAAVRAGVGAGDRTRLSELARTTRIAVNTDPEHGDADEVLWVDGEPAGGLVRDPRHAPLLSALSQVPEVRAALLEAQRAPAADGAVAVGRDTGTVVFPDAAVKLYLQAAEDVRESRRAAQLRGEGRDVDAGVLRHEVAERDRSDAPSMVMAAGAVVIDTGTLDVEGMLAVARERCAAAGLHPVERR
jgi:cytidylate kinase